MNDQKTDIVTTDDIAEFELEIIEERRPRERFGDTTIVLTDKYVQEEIKAHKNQGPFSLTIVDERFDEQIPIGDPRDLEDLPDLRITSEDLCGCPLEDAA